LYPLPGAPPAMVTVTRLAIKRQAIGLSAGNARIRIAQRIGYTAWPEHVYHGAAEHLIASMKFDLQMLKVFWMLTPSLSVLLK